MLGMTAAWKLVKCIFTVWRFKQMVKHTMNVAKGIGMGVLAGVAVAAVSSKVMNGGHKKASHMRKSAGKAMHPMAALIGEGEKMLRCPPAAAQAAQAASSRRAPGRSQAVRPAPTPWGKHRPEAALPFFLKHAGQAPQGRPGDFFSTYSIPRTRAKENRQVSACLLVI